MHDDERSRFTHVFLTGTDLSALRDFYAGLIGLVVLIDEGEYIRLGGRGGADIGLEAVSDAELPAIEINIEVPDVEAAYQRLSVQGTEFESSPMDMPWGARHVWLRDPAGHRVSLYSPKE